MLEAEVFVSAVGQLNRPKTPDIEGLEDFDGPMFHTARWDHSFDPQDKTVAVIGNGASAILYAVELINHLTTLRDVLVDKGDSSGRFDPPHTTLSVGVIEGGTATNIVPRSTLANM